MMFRWWFGLTRNPPRKTKFNVLIANTPLEKKVHAIFFLFFQIGLDHHLSVYLISDVIQSVWHFDIVSSDVSKHSGLRFNTINKYNKKKTTLPLMVSKQLGLL